MEDTLGQRIGRLREERRLSQAVLARRSQISRQMLYMIESGRTANPGALQIAAIAQQLGVSTDAILLGAPTPKKRWVLVDDEDGEVPRGNHNTPHLGRTTRGTSVQEQEPRRATSHSATRTVYGA